MVRRRAGQVFACFAAAAAIAAGCGDDESDAGDSAPSGADVDHGDHGTAPADDEVVMRLIAFGPQSLTVPTGTTVTWRQDDAGFHTVTSGTVTQGSAGVTPEPDGSFASEEIPKGATFEHEFTAPGTFPYYCEIHPATMRGEIAVT